MMSLLRRRRPAIIEPTPIDPARYVKAVDRGATRLWHLDGTGWMDVGVPPEHHVCWVQTKGCINWFETVHRCGCGATSMPRPGVSEPYWMERNSRIGRP